MARASYPEFPEFPDLDKTPGLDQEDEVTFMDWSLTPEPEPARTPINVQPRPPTSLITRRLGDKFETLEAKGTPY